MWRHVLCCVLVCTLTAHAEDSLSRPHPTRISPSQLKDGADIQPVKPKLSGIASSTLKLDPIKAATTVTGFLGYVRPYLVNPLHLSANVKWFMVLAVLSFVFLLKTVTAVFTFVLSPDKFAFNLCCGTALFHASLFALRGPREQLARLTTTERMPHTMTTFISLLAAYWASTKREYAGSMLFGAAHFFAFFLDACSHIPGGKALFKFALGCYLSLVRWLLALLGIKFETPRWMAGVISSSSKAEKPAARSSSLSSLFSGWLSMGSGSQSGAKEGMRNAIDGLANERVIFIPAAKNASVPAGAVVLGVRALGITEAASLATTIAIGEPIGWQTEWLRPADLRANETASASESIEVADADRRAVELDVRATWWRCEIGGEENATLRITDEVRRVEANESDPDATRLDPSRAWDAAPVPREINVQSSLLLSQIRSLWRVRRRVLAQQANGSAMVVEAESPKRDEPTTARRPQLPVEEGAAKGAVKGKEKRGARKGRGRDGISALGSETSRAAVGGARHAAVRPATADETPTLAGVLLRVRLAEERKSSWLNEAMGGVNWLNERVSSSVGGGGQKVRQFWEVLASDSVNSAEGGEGVEHAPSARLIEPMRDSEWDEVKSFGWRVLQSTNSSVRVVQSWSSVIGSSTGRLLSGWGAADSLGSERLVPPTRADGKLISGGAAAKAHHRLRRQRQQAMQQRELEQRAHQQLLRQRLAQIRAEQLLALAMSREHQLLQLMRLAAAVSQTDPELEQALPLSRLLAAKTRAASMAAQARAEHKSTFGSSGAGPATAEGSEDDLRNDEQLYLSTALVPYSARPKHTFTGQHVDGYSSFLMDELQRLLSEAFVPAPTVRSTKEHKGKPHAKRGSEEAVDHEIDAEIAAEREQQAQRALVEAAARQRIVEEDRAAAVAELSQIKESLQKDISSVKSKLQSLFGSGSSPPAEDKGEVLTLPGRLKPASKAAKHPIQEGESKEARLKLSPTPKKNTTREGGVAEARPKPPSKAGLQPVQESHSEPSRPKPPSKAGLQPVQESHSEPSRPKRPSKAGVRLSERDRAAERAHRERNLAVEMQSKPHGGLLKKMSAGEDSDMLEVVVEEVDDALEAESIWDVGGQSEDRGRHLNAHPLGDRSPGHGAISEYEEEEEERQELKQVRSNQLDKDESLDEELEDDVSETDPWSSIKPVSDGLQAAGTQAVAATAAMADSVKSTFQSFLGRSGASHTGKSAKDELVLKVPKSSARASTKGAGGPSAKASSNKRDVEEEDGKPASFGDGLADSFGGFWRQAFGGAPSQPAQQPKASKRTSRTGLRTKSKQGGDAHGEGASSLSGKASAKSQKLTPSNSAKRPAVSNSRAAADRTQLPAARRSEARSRNTANIAARRAKPPESAVGEDEDDGPNDKDEDDEC